MTALLIFIAAILLMMVRNWMTYSFRIRRIREISAANRRDIGHRDFMERMNRRFMELDRPSYMAMWLDLRRWTYRQFYPSEVV